MSGVTIIRIAEYVTNEMFEKFVDWQQSATVMLLSA
jgi:hypothetical protein